MQLKNISPSTSSFKTGHYFTKKTDEEMQPLSLMEQGQWPCTSSTLNYFSSASNTIAPTHSSGYLKIKVFLDFLSDLPKDLIGIIHGFLSYAEKNENGWRHAFERGFLFDPLDHDARYLSAIVHAVSSAPQTRNTEWNSLIRLVSEIQKNETDVISPQVFFVLSEMIFSSIDSEKIKQTLFSAKTNYFAKKVYAPMAGFAGTALGGIYASYWLFYKSGVSENPVWMRILTFDAGCLVTLFVLVCLLRAFYIWITRTGSTAKFEIEQILREFPQMDLDLSSIGLTSQHAKAMKNEIVRLLEGVTLAEKEELNHFLSSLPFLIAK